MSYPLILPQAAREGGSGHVKCPTLGEGPLIDPLVKAPNRPRRGIVGDLIDKCIITNYKLASVHVLAYLPHFTFSIKINGTKSISMFESLL